MNIIKYFLSLITAGLLSLIGGEHRNQSSKFESRHHIREMRSSAANIKYNSSFSLSSKSFSSPLKFTSFHSGPSKTQSSSFFKRQRDHKEKNIDEGLKHLTLWNEDNEKIRTDIRRHSKPRIIIEPPLSPLPKGSAPSFLADQREPNSVQKNGINETFEAYSLKLQNMKKKTERPKKKVYSTSSPLDPEETFTLAVGTQSESPLLDETIKKTNSSKKSTYAIDNTNLVSSENIFEDDQPTALLKNAEKASPQNEKVPILGEETKRDSSPSNSTETIEKINPPEKDSIVVDNSNLIFSPRTSEDTRSTQISKTSEKVTQLTNLLMNFSKPTKAVSLEEKKTSNLRAEVKSGVFPANEIIKETSSSKKSSHVVDDAILVSSQHALENNQPTVLPKNTVKNSIVDNLNLTFPPHVSGDIHSNAVLKKPEEVIQLGNLSKNFSEQFEAVSIEDKKIQKIPITIEQLAFPEEEKSEMISSAEVLAQTQGMSHFIEKDSSEQLDTHVLEEVLSVEIFAQPEEATIEDQEIPPPPPPPPEEEKKISKPIDIAKITRGKISAETAQNDEFMDALKKKMAAREMAAQEKRKKLASENPSQPEASHVAPEDEWLEVERKRLEESRAAPKTVVKRPMWYKGKMREPTDSLYAEALDNFLNNHHSQNKIRKGKSSPKKKNLSEKALRLRNHLASEAKKGAGKSLSDILKGLSVSGLRKAKQNANQNVQLDHKAESDDPQEKLIRELSKALTQGNLLKKTKIKSPFIPKHKSPVRVALKRVTSPVSSLFKTNKDKETEVIVPNPEMLFSFTKIENSPSPINSSKDEESFSSILTSSMKKPTPPAPVEEIKKPFDFSSLLQPNEKKNTPVKVTPPGAKKFKVSPSLKQTIFFPPLQPVSEKINDSNFSTSKPIERELSQKELFLELKPRYQQKDKENQNPNTMNPGSRKITRSLSDLVAIFEQQ